MISAAAVYLNAVLCTDETRQKCEPPQFMYTVQEPAPAAFRAEQCQVLAEAMNAIQLDKAIFYRCDPVRGTSV